ncbi:hypothetical protein [Serratia inhibens]|uniref:hypothetical protein n=1 Tax=Serratia inhibens TaxID=2338073 RepID=UPI0011DFF820|nr:hypothetical protein [Serratia inhibens]
MAFMVLFSAQNNAGVKYGTGQRTTLVTVLYASFVGLQSQFHNLLPESLAVAKNGVLTSWLSHFRVVTAPAGKT